MAEPSLENICTSAGDPDIDEWLESQQPDWRKDYEHMAEEKQAIRDWHTRAWVRILETMTKRSPEGGEHTFQSGDVLVMFQWGRAGRSVDRSVWWTSYDIDGAFIILADKVEIIEILEEVSPFDE